MQQLFHYYGDEVRRLFLLGAVVMALTLPFFQDLIHQPLEVSLGAILIVGIAAGLTNPRQGWVAMMDIVISIVATLVFEYNAVQNYSLYGSGSGLFWADQVLALIFLVALYYASKTLRGSWLNR
jgi:hypothetical protein